MGGFVDFFEKATGHRPYKYQEDLAGMDAPPTILRVPTGCGKTAAAVLSWLWRRKEKPEATPRRLVYCLPMRVLVEQTHGSVAGWLGKLGLGEEVGVAVLVGGGAAIDRDWANEPERPYVIIGTQDMLLSRALNRGYGSTPFRWPVEFGLLNNDCMWVVDEVQLMKNGLPTSLQLQALRERIGTCGPSRTMWMSATVEEESMLTVDYKGHEELRPDGADLGRITGAKKKLAPLKGVVLKDAYDKNTVETILGFPRPTLVIVNKVKRAQELFRMIEKKAPGLLVHSRFRPAERAGLNERLAGIKQDEDIVIVGTQALEAGVDVSARTLVTELAPAASLVQRFGRCNRRGEYGDSAVHWIDAETDGPYDPGDLEAAREWLSGAGSASPQDLSPPGGWRGHDMVLRRPDLVDLFDTAPDLSGSYLDVSRFVRTGNLSTDVAVYWRNFDGKPLDGMERHVQREVCAVPISGFKDFLAGHKAWLYDHSAEDYPDSDRWIQARGEDVRPGQTFLLPAGAGGYTRAYGWDAASAAPVEPAEAPAGSGAPQDAGREKTLEQHTDEVCGELGKILEGIGAIIGGARSALEEAARYHDLGKAHEVFQEMVSSSGSLGRDKVWAKSGGGSARYARPGFRHEAASAIAYLGRKEATDLTAYLIASHHGKVRAAMRSPRPPGRDGGSDEYLLGLRTDSRDELPETALGGGVTAPRTRLDVSVARLGGSGGSPSWLERTLRLRDDPEHGPFRLAYLESVLRAADVRASAGG